MACNKIELFIAEMMSWTRLTISQKEELLQQPEYSKKIQENI